MGWIGRHKYSDLLGVRKDFVQYFDRLGCHVTEQIGYPRDISSRLGKAFDEPRAYWVCCWAHDDWNVDVAR